MITASVICHVNDLDPQLDEPGPADRSGLRRLVISSGPLRTSWYYDTVGQLDELAARIGALAARLRESESSSSLAGLAAPSSSSREGDGPVGEQQPEGGSAAVSPAVGVVDAPVGAISADGAPSGDFGSFSMWDGARL